MTTSPFDINCQVERILSSNFNQQFGNSVSFEPIHSPCIRKQQQFVQQHHQSCLNDMSVQKSFIQDDLYEKAEQIFRLKQMLESQLSNISQIVKQNQRLTEMNVTLESELAKIKNQFEKYKNQNQKHDKIVVKQFNTAKQTIVQRNSQIQQLEKRNTQYMFQIQKLQSFEDVNTKLRRNQMTSSVKKDQKLEIFAQIQYQISLKGQKMQLVDFSCQNSYESRQVQELNIKIKELTQRISELQTKNNDLHLKAKQKQKLPQQIAKQPKPLLQKQVGKNKIECYQSVFLNSVCSQDQDVEETIRQALFNNAVTLFDQLQESKYFGKIVQKIKNGVAVEQYTNGFVFQGNFLKNQRHGTGKLFYKDKLVYSGLWKQGHFQGKGFLFYYSDQNVQKIQGNFLKGVLQGHSTLIFKSGSKLRVYFKNNQLSGDAMLKIKENQEFFQNKFNLGNIKKNMPLNVSSKQNLCFTLPTGKNILLI